MGLKELFPLLALLCISLSAPEAQSASVTCATGKYPPDPKTKVKSYVVNLDLAPEKRWEQVATEKGPEIKALLAGFKEFLRDWGSIAGKLVDIIDSYGGSFDKTLPYPFAQEIKAIADYSGVNMGEIVLYNLFYEIFTACTSIVAEDANGELYHARNLDFGLFIGWDVKNKTWSLTERLRPLIVQLDWQRGGQTVFKSVNYAGYTGILTAVKPKIFTMSMDKRFGTDGAIEAVIKWLTGKRNESWMGFLTRSVMENATSYDHAVSKLSTSPMLVPAYFIVGGNQTGQGSVITRSSTESLQYWSMKDASKWYILETNYDHWKAPLFLDDRRSAAHKCMDKTGQNGIDIAGMFNVLSSEPMLNKLTTYTALMKVSTGDLETYIQYCKDPCTPW